MAEIEITINGETLKMEEGRTILWAANTIGVQIPTLCHDFRLKPVGACRVCVVEVEGEGSLVPSCITGISAGMVVRTDTERVHNARKAVIELLLSNHPTDCMTCEVCGNCALQDLAHEYGVRESRYFSKPAGGIKEDRNRAIQFDSSKCILCGRCVRICNEVQQDEAINFIGRGFDMTIGPAFNDSLLDSSCVLCGQCVSTCPVGALVEKQAAGKTRAWDVKKVQTVCGYCGVGCNIFLNVKDDKVVKVTSEVGTVPNDGNLCIKGRFGKDMVHHPDRLKEPMIRKNGHLEEVTWDEAFDYIADKLQTIKEKDGPDSIGCIASSRCTNEEDYLMQKFARAVIGTNNIDECART